MSLKKICTKCNIELDINCFNKNKTGLYGYFSQCKECVKKLEKIRRSLFPEKYLESRKKTYYKNRENRKNHEDNRTK